jgi:hypothetical protein
MPQAQVWRIRDGKQRIHVYPDRTAELTNDRGVLIFGRAPLYRITDRLLRIDETYDQLIPRVTGHMA